MEGLIVEVNTAELERRLSLLPGQITLAAKRAAARTRDWLATQLRRELSAAAKLPALATKTRFHKGKPSEETPSSVFLWIGVNPVEATKAGKAIRTAKGIRAGRHVFDHAFLATMKKSGHEGVFLRKGKARLPIVKVTIPIHEGAEALLAKYEEPAARMFSDRLEHEVNYLLTSGRA